MRHIALKAAAAQIRIEAGERMRIARAHPWIPYGVQWYAAAMDLFEVADQVEEAAGSSTSPRRSTSTS